jgi:hypothetical protein
MFETFILKNQDQIIVSFEINHNFYHFYFSQTVV